MLLEVEVNYSIRGISEIETDEVYYLLFGMPSANKVSNILEPISE